MSTAHGFCFAVLCCGYTLTDFPISIRLTSLALWQSNDCPSASKATLMNMDKYFMWIHYERLHNHNKAKHNKTVCIFLGIYCTDVAEACNMVKLLTLQKLTIGFFKVYQIPDSNRTLNQVLKIEKVLCIKICSFLSSQFPWVFLCRLAIMHSESVLRLHADIKGKMCDCIKYIQNDINTCSWLITDFFSICLNPLNR